MRLRTLLTTVVILASTLSGLTTVDSEAMSTPLWGRSSHAVDPHESTAHDGTSAIPDIAIDGAGDADGYHLRVASGASGFEWQDIAVLRPANLDPGSWYGYQCLTSNGRYAAVAVLPGDEINDNQARDHGAFAYSVDIKTGKVRPLSSGVGLKYHSPECGVSSTAVFTSSPGENERSTVAQTFALATGKQTEQAIVAGQVTSVVPTNTGLVGAMGNWLVSLGRGGAVEHPSSATRIARLQGGAYDLRPAADGGVDLLEQREGDVVTIAHEHAGRVTSIGKGTLSSTHLFQGADGRNLVTSVVGVDRSQLRQVDDSGLPFGAEVVSLRGGAAFGQSDAPAPKRKGQKAMQSLLATASGYPLMRLERTGKVSTSKAVKGSSAIPSEASGRKAPGGGLGRRELTQPAPHETVPKAGAHTSAFVGIGAASPTVVAAAQVAIRPALSAGATTPKCGVARLDPTLQSMQPSNAQVDWATQMAEQNLLTNSYLRPANYANMGLASYSPNGDFAPTSLLHPASDTWSTVPRSVMDAIEAQESNFNQASWHALPSIAGDPLIGDYYGSGDSISTINYALADCGYGVAQVTTGMAAADTSITPHGKMKVAVDYQENIAAGLTILERIWNQLYSAGITANNADPRYLENWFLAAWAYNSGVQPTAQFGNTTGCTPSATCTGPDGTWGLGWSNNPRNPDYDPSRAPYLKNTYADAAHPSSWPYEERIMGWMGSPLIRYGYIAYGGPDYHGGNTWLQVPGVNTFCTSANDCSPTNTSGGYCSLSDLECWWHQPVTWVTNCATTCATADYQDAAGSSEPTHADPYPPTCNQDTSKVPSNAIVVDDLATPSQNLQGCSGMNWSTNGTFSYSPGTNSSGDPVGNIDTHQLGSGFGGHILFTHTESSSTLINTGTWAPNLPSLQYYKIKLHIPASGATATDVVYTINPGGSASPWKIRVNQDWKSEQWVTIGTFAMQNGGNVQLSNKSAMTPGAYDVAFDAIAFVPMGGTPGKPIGGPPTIQDAPKGSNPAWVNCGCVRRTAGDPVDTATGYFGESATDLRTSGLGEALNMTRSYSAVLADASGPAGTSVVNGPFGYGWTFVYGMSATVDGSGNVTVHQEDGSEVPFTLASGAYTPSAPRFDATLTKSGTMYVFTRHATDRFTFDATTGRLLSISDPAGRAASTPYATVLAYDASGHLSTVTDPGGRKYTFTWTGTHITTVASDAGQKVDYSYSAAGDLTDVFGVGTTRTGGVDGDQDHAQYAYNTKHLMTTERSPDNYGKSGTPTPVTSMTYDASDRVTTQTDPLGHATTFAYGPDATAGIAAGQTLVTDPAGHQALYTYDSGLLTSLTRGYGSAGASTWSYAYDPVTLGVSVQTNPDGSTLTYSYDDAGHLTSSSDGLGRTTNYQYDAAGKLLEETDPTGMQTVTAYNAAEQPTSVTRTLQGESAESANNTLNPSYARGASYAYTDAAHPGEPTSFTDPNGNATSYGYDGFGDVVSKTDAAGDQTKYKYDTSLGQLTAVVSPTGVAAGVATTCTPPAIGCTTYTHDAYGHVTATTDPDGHVTKATYDADGNQLTSTDGNNHTTTTAYDAADEAVTVKKPSGDVSTTLYNPDGTVASTKDAASHATTYLYDAQGRAVSTTNPDSKTTTFTYDPMGRVLTTTKPNGDVQTQAWDGAGQLSGTSYSGSSTPTSFTYDVGGRRTSMIDGTGTTTYQYDVFGETTSVSAPAGTTTYGYDAAGNTTSIGYPTSGTTITRAFNNIEQLASITDPSHAVISFGYNKDGAPTTTTYPNGTTSTVAVDNADLPKSSSLVKGATALGTITYARDNTGDLTGMTPTSGAPGAATSYGYNTNQYLTSTTVGSTTTSYGYDSVGDPTTLGSSTQVFDAAGELCWSTTLSVTSPTCASPASGATKYSYDANGNRTAKTPASGTATAYAYNAAGELTSVSGAATATYTYNGDGLRASKVTSGGTSTFTWDARGSVPQMLCDGTTDYVYGPTGAPVEQFTAGGANPAYYFTDAHGSTVDLTGSGGAVTGSYTYSAWGAVATHTGASTPIEFASAFVDAETGLLYLQARYYDPATGSFTSIDALVGKTLAAYLYASDDPLNLLDPLGLWGLTAADWGAIAAVGIGIGMVALAATGVGAIADVAAIGIAAAAGTAEAGAGLATAAAVVGGVGELADWTAVGAGAIGVGFDTFACVGHHDSGACGAAVANTIGLGMGGGGLAFAAGGYDAYGIAMGVNSIPYTGIGFGLDYHGYEESCSRGREK